MIFPTDAELQLLATSLSLFLKVVKLQKVDDTEVVGVVPARAPNCAIHICCLGLFLGLMVALLHHLVHEFLLLFYFLRNLGCSSRSRVESLFHYQQKRIVHNSQTRKKSRIVLEALKKSLSCPWLKIKHSWSFSKKLDQV